MTEPAWLSEVCGDCGESYRKCICGGALRAEVRYLRGKEAEAEELSERLAAAQITIGQLSHERARLREGFARLQWAGTHCERDREMAACPVCDVLADSEVVGQRPHEPDCWLAAELGTKRP